MIYINIESLEMEKIKNLNLESELFPLLQIFS